MKLKGLAPLPVLALSITLLLTTVLTPVHAQTSVAGTLQTIDCTSRECLIELAQDYLAALVAHDASRLPFASDVKFVENAYRKPMGEGLWRSASKEPGNFAIFVPDPVSKQVGFLGMMEEDGHPLMFGLRLQVINGEIAEVEHLLARIVRDSQLENLQTLRPGINKVLPEAERMSRHELIGIGYSYYDALELDDGTLAPMAADCERHENGMITVRPIPTVPPEGPPNFGLMGCQGQLNTGVMGYIDSLDNRRVELADPVTGLVMGFSHFRHAMTQKMFPITGVEGITEREINFDAFDLPAAHIFKVRDGWIHEIEAMGFMAPYMAKTGWE